MSVHTRALGTNVAQLASQLLLFRLLNEVPLPSTENDPPEGLALQHGGSRPRILSLSKEKELTEALALLIGITGDPRKVPAVCVEEHQAGNRMTISVAANSGDMALVKAGLLRITRLLQTVCSNGRHSNSGVQNLDQNLDAEIFREAVSMNQNRLLCRLRSKHANHSSQYGKSKALRPKVIATLVVAFAGVSGDQPLLLVSAVAGNPRDDVQELQSLFANLEMLDRADALSRRGLKILVDIVTTSRRLYSSRVLESVLELSTLEPEAKLAVDRIVATIGRYRTASSFLFRAAHEYAIFANIDIRVLKAPPRVTAPVDNKAEILNDTVMALFGAHESKTAMLMVNARLNRNPRRPMNPPRFGKLLATTELPVHAEIQLMAFYETRHCDFPPRVICSSKKACYLCNMFFNIHGRYFTPSTHGKLYEKWTLPQDWCNSSADQPHIMLPMIVEFRARLEECLKQEIASPAKKLLAPPESLCAMSVIWQSPEDTEKNLEVTIDSGYEDGQAKSPPRPPNIDQSTAGAETVSEHDLSSKPTSNSQPTLRWNPEEARDKTSVPVLDPAPELYPALVKQLRLSKGTSQTFRLSPQTPLLRVITLRIHITLSYNAWKRSSVSLAAASNNSIDTGCRITLKWLSISEIPLSESALIDLEDFSPGTQKTFNQFAGSCDFYVGRGNDAISIKTAY